MSSQSEWGNYANFENIVDQRPSIDHTVAQWNQKYGDAAQSAETPSARIPTSTSASSISSAFAYDGSAERRLSETQASPAAPGANSTMRMLNPRTQEFELRRLQAQTEQQRQDKIRSDQEREYLRLEQQRRARAERLEQLQSEHERELLRQDELSRARAQREHLLRRQMDEAGAAPPPIPQKEPLFYAHNAPSSPPRAPIASVLVPTPAQPASQLPVVPGVPMVPGAPIAQIVPPGVVPAPGLAPAIPQPQRSAVPSLPMAHGQQPSPAPPVPHIGNQQLPAAAAPPVPLAPPAHPPPPANAAPAPAQAPPAAPPDDGAATMVEQTRDEEGVVRSRIVRKGVQDFEFKGELGSGSYSTVLLALDKQSLRQYAVKVLDKNHIIKERKVKYVEIEKRTLNRLGDHPGIIRLYFTFQDRHSLYFVLDYAPNGELLHLIKSTGSLNEDCARYYACQLLDAIEYMHENGVIHRDLKPENILLDYKVRVKVTDFGTAKLLDMDPETNEYPTDTRADSFVGTAEYVTPELLVNKQQGKSADIWAWGCVLYQMIAAAPPFQGTTQYLTFQKVSRIQYSIPPGFPFLVRDLLKHILVKAPQRWSIADIKQHEFFEGQDWSRKALWSTPPPKLGPYRPNVASMKPRATRVPPVEAAKQRAAAGKQVFIPTPGGLQAVNPTTVYGMPVRHVEPSASQSTTHLHGSAASHAPSSTAHTSGPTSVAHKRTSSRGRVPIKAQTKPVAKPASVKPAAATSSASNAGAGSKNANTPTTANLYKAPVASSQSSQHQKAEALRRRMQDYKINTRVAAVSSTSRPGTPTSPRMASGFSPVTSALARPSSPRSPSTTVLPRLPSGSLEAQYGSVLVDLNERILKVGQLYVWISSHKPQHVKPDHEKTEEPGDELFVPDASMFSKLFTSKNKKKTVLVTTLGRLVVMNDDHRIQTEVPLGVPQVEVSEPTFLIDKEKRPRIVIRTYNKVITLDDPKHNSVWLETIQLSKQYYLQTITERERDTFNAAAAAASAVTGRRF